ncbi:MAG: hypothetical protein O7D30_06325 [Rickettsia endosymbiont of Ixodes persulcatus]|nr:hypothetical protein [Rickettsia endosymbiont of Ixodes persulcatus]
MIDVCPLTTDEVAAFHKFPAKPEKVLGIIVTFFRQATRNQWLHNKKKLARHNNIHLRHNMTKQNKALLKEWSKEKSFGMFGT